MTFGVATKHILFGALIPGLAAAGIFHSICSLTGLEQMWTWYVRGALIVVGAALWLAFRILQERVMLKDYQKMVAQRDRRMR